MAMKRWMTVAATVLTLTGGLALASPAQAASPTMPLKGTHVVNTIKERAVVQGKRYSVNFLITRLAKPTRYNNSYCSLVVKSPGAQELYRTKLTMEACWEMHTIWAERGEPRGYRTFASQAKLLKVVRGEVHESRIWDRQINAY